MSCPASTSYVIAGFVLNLLATLLLIVNTSNVIETHRDHFASKIRVLETEEAKHVERIEMLEGQMEWMAMRTDSMIDRLDKLDGRVPHPAEGRTSIGDPGGVLNTTPDSVLTPFPDPISIGEGGEEEAEREFRSALDQFEKEIEK